MTSVTHKTLYTHHTEMTALHKKMTTFYKGSKEEECKSYESSYFGDTPYLGKLLSTVVPISSSQQREECQKVASGLWCNCDC